MAGVELMHEESDAEKERWEDTQRGLRASGSEYLLPLRTAFVEVWTKCSNSKEGGSSN